MKCIYLDNNATTPLDPRVYTGMAPYNNVFFGNPSSTHEFGYKAAAALLKARKRLADLLGTGPQNILFTSGATESNNMVVLGYAMKYLPMFNKKAKDNSSIHIITSSVEHKCILETCKRAAEWGAEVTVLPVDEYGIVNIAKLKKAIRPNTRLISLIFANNEVGSLNPIEEVGVLCRSKGITFHTDAAQAVGKVAIDVNSMNIDLLSVSGHKFYGPKGVGALYIRDGLEFTPSTLGGGQELGLRSGTHNVPGIVGLGLAAEIAGNDMLADNSRISEMSHWLTNEILQNISGSQLNGHPELRLCNNINISFKGLSKQFIRQELKGIAFSSSSACSSKKSQASYVLKAMGLNDELAMTTIRLGLGRFTTWEEVRETARRLIDMGRQNSAH